MLSPRELQKINFTEQQQDINIQEQINDNNKINKFVSLQQKVNIGDVDKDTGQIIIPEKLQKKTTEKLRPKDKNQPIEYEVEAIVDQYTGEDNKQYYEVKWKGYDESQNTTERFQNIKDTEAYKIWKKR